MQTCRLLSRLTALAFGLAALGGGFDAKAQTYVCPPGYYFLAGYGCYPFGGYATPAPPPAYYYYPNYPYAVPAPPPPAYYPAYPYGGGFTFEFGGRRDEHHDRNHR